MRNRNLHIQPPENETFVEWLRYLVQSSDTAAGELPFLVSMWNCALFSKGLTEAQQAAVLPYITEGQLFLEAHVYAQPETAQPAPATGGNVIDINDRKGK